MNAMRILICATFAIIVAALAYTVVKQDDEPTLAELRQRLYEKQRAKEKNDSFTDLGFNTETPVPTMSDLEAELAAEAAKPAEPVLTPEQITQLANEAESQLMAQQELENELKKPAQDKNSSRAQVIAQALTMATVNHFDATQQIVIVDLKRPESIVRGQILGIRRDNGILGRVKLAGKVKSNPSQAFADPVISSFFGGKVDIRVGDELIIVP